MCKIHKVKTWIISIDFLIVKLFYICLHRKKLYLKFLPNFSVNRCMIL